MGEFKERNFVKELAYRTKVNYYEFRSINTIKEAQIIENKELDSLEKRELLDYKDNVKAKLEETKKLMSEEGFGVDKYFEVTLMINSLMGLLVFPQQQYYEKIKKSIKKNDFSRFRELEECMRSTGKFYSSYGEEEMQQV